MRNNYMAVSAILLTGILLLSSCAKKTNCRGVSSSAVSFAFSSASSTVSSSSQTQESSGVVSLWSQAYELYMQNQYDDAVSLCDKAISQDANCYEAYNIKGIAIYFANGNSYSEKSIGLINQSLAISPNYAYGYFNRALIYKGLKQFDQSIADFNKDLELKPNDAWAYFGISTIYADTNDINQSLDYLEKSINADPSVKQTARTESHFAKMHDNARFQQLVK